MVVRWRVLLMLVISSTTSSIASADVSGDASVSGVSGDVAVSSQCPILNIPELGSLCGTTDISAWSNITLYKYHSIPYALPPSGHRRFKPPEPAHPWNGVLDASKFGKKCPQANTEKELRDLRMRINSGEDVEDCLTLNVYTPVAPEKCDKNRLLPVMFYIHGGSFRVGSAHNFQPNYLLDSGEVVLVVAQYRLGPLGFLSLQTDELPGNMGFMDMVLAMKWTQKYIRFFCGDSSKVTLFGQSAGGAAVTLMMASPLVSPDMFQRVIVQSGSSLCDWALDRDPVEHAKRIAELANCTDQNLDELALCLHRTNTWELLVAHSDFLTEVLVTEGQAVKGNNGGNHAVIQAAGPNAFLIEDPHVLFKEGRYRHVPMMAGITKHEGSFFLGNIYDFILVRDNNTNDTEYLKKEFIKDTLKFSGIDDTTGAVTDTFQDKYFKDDEVGNFTAMIPGLIDICGVTLLKACLLQQIRHNRQLQPSYLYSFNYKGHLTKFGYGEEVNYPFGGGVAHSDDLIYLFPHPKGELKPHEVEVAKTVVKIWTSFAIDGQPYVNDDVEWLPMSTANGPYLRIALPSQLKENFMHEYNITVTEGYDDIEDMYRTSDGQNLRAFNLGLSLTILLLSLRFL
ncbi:esterase E4 isoform X2 [Nilaparvata lugens]|uniref:esterase E4 isoform X2 n=1 Tax=Nilaparvata lugens TaxID=108931 RepID=UPI00193D6455|nr:esterase E4 isoform X2 [Nilaparvata lugens]